MLLDNRKRERQNNYRREISKYRLARRLPDLLPGMANHLPFGKIPLPSSTRSVCRLRLPLPGQPLGFGQLLQGHRFLQMVLELFSEVITLACRQGVPPIRLNRIFRDTSALGINNSKVHLCLCMARSANSRNTCTALW